MRTILLFFFLIHIGAIKAQNDFNIITIIPFDRINTELQILEVGGALGISADYIYVKRGSDRFKINLNEKYEPKEGKQVLYGFYMNGEEKLTYKLTVHDGYAFTLEGSEPRKWSELCYTKGVKEESLNIKTYKDLTVKEKADNRRFNTAGIH